MRESANSSTQYQRYHVLSAATLSNGDEVQIGKFRLVFIAGQRPEGEGGRA